MISVDQKSRFEFELPEEKGKLEIERFALDK